MIPFAAKEFESINTYKGLDGLFVEGFILNDTRNKNKWRATWESIQKCYADFMGRPGIEYLKCIGTVCDRDHTNGITYKQNMAAQEMFRETNIIDMKLDEKKRTLSAVEHILTSQFERKIETKTVKYRSPSLWPIRWEIVGKENGIDLIDIHEWMALHIAYVDKPAFGNDVKIYTSCKDHGSACKVHFKATDNSASFPLQQIPLIVRHNKRLHITNVDEQIDKLVNAKITKGLQITDKIFDTSARGTALTANCTTCQSKKLNYKYKKLQKIISNN